VTKSCSPHLIVYTLTMHDIRHKLTHLLLPPSPLLKVGLALTVCLSLLVSSAVAQVHNARVVGDLRSLNKLLTTPIQPMCGLPSCPIEFKPVVLSLRSPHAAHLKIVLTKAKISNPPMENEENDVAGRPILLRGKTVPAPGSTGLARPVAATIFRDSQIPTLEIVVADSPQSSAKASRGLLVFRYKLTEAQGSARLNARVQASSSQAFAAKLCGAHADDFDYQIKPLSSSSLEAAAAPTYSVLYIGTDYDQFFAKSIKCSSTKACQNRILSIINQAAVLYERQLGYTLEVARQFGPTNHGRATRSESVIDGFQQYNFANRLQHVHTATNPSANQVDVFKLFTGRKMDDDVIGIAYVGTICQDSQSRFANAVVQHVSSTLNPITTAHEIGHTLSAQHVPDGIMRANLGSAPPTSFSTASVQTIISYLSQWYRECRQGVSKGVANPTPTPTSSDSSNPFPGKPKTLQLIVSSPSAQTVTVSTTVSAVTAGCSTRIRAAATSRRTPQASPILEVTQTEAGNSAVGAATFRVLPDKLRNVNVYFFADYSCPNGNTIEVSRTVRFNPNRVTGIAKRARSKRAWIAALKQSLR
jgi:hypothetical protein